MNYQAPPIPTHFLFRRLHSLMGVFLVLFLIEHLFTNSQAALYFGLEGTSFIRMVNWIHNLPYLPIIEICALALPFALHAVWGIIYIKQAEFNCKKNDGTAPHIAYGHNYRYSWQRMTSWILVLGLILHVIHMRFIELPQDIGEGSLKRFSVVLNFDEGLYDLAASLGFLILDKKDIVKHKQDLEENNQMEQGSFEELLKKKEVLSEGEYSFVQEAISLDLYRLHQHQELIRKVETYALKEKQIVAITQDFGTATLLVVRDTFKNPWMVVCYTLFVLASCYHAFNGLWTFAITWGITLSQRSQQILFKGCVFLGITFSILGLMAIFGSFGILSH